MSETSRDLASHAESLSAKVDVEIESIKINDLLESTNSEKKEAAAAAEELSLDEVTEASDLSNLSRRIWIVTTAALPWMTGTAVNPLLRALSLAEHRSKDTVTLMIPWLPSKDARAFLYGSCKQTFENPQEQEAWIRQYCIDRCNCTEQTAGNLRIQFWKGVYQESFASIFPLEDICSTIPRDEADICILEEPEHLNWFRVPAKPKGSKYTLETSIEPSIEVEDEGGNVVEISESCDLEESESGWNWNGASVIRDADIEILGWSLKFRHVVGILHTNYADYIRQYGMASVVTAPALNALSSLVVKAYCHKVIRLSATLPHLDATKEVTCNVHGVRHEFLQRPENPGEQQDVEESKVDEVEDNGEKLTLSSDTTPKLASVYFIGKLIWAKGFEHVLELEEKYKEAKGEYFSMDIYGGGKDEKDIKLAFFGRTGMSPSPSSVQLDAESSVPADAKAPDLKSVFGSSNSLRDQLSTGDGTVEDDYVVVGNTEQAESEKTTNIGSESLVLATSKTEDLAVSTSVNDTDRAAVDAAPNAAPLDVLGDLSGKTLSTTVDTADATMKLIESVMKAGINAISGGKEGTKGKDGGEAAVSPKMSLPFNIAPAKTRFKWRRNAVPARFLGVQDHIVVRDIPEHKIFLNMSTSEVLCTTTAEALAMGKFVILPKHPSNEFFLQFPNCLHYKSIDECVKKLYFALENSPEPLSETHVHALSWEGATERLVTASAITNRDLAMRARKGLDKADIKAAQFHVDAGNNSDWLRAKILK